MPERHGRYEVQRCISLAFHRSGAHPTMRPPFSVASRSEAKDHFLASPGSDGGDDTTRGLTFARNEIENQGQSPNQGS
eukprot:11171112-Lingulodinium_polyedra.AAC.1